MVKPSAKRSAYGYLRERHEASKRSICQTLGLYRSTLDRKSVKDDSETEAKLKELAKRYPTRGLDYYYGKIRMEGLKWNYKRVRRVYNKLGLKLRRKHKRRLNRPYKEGLSQPIFSNVTWSMDFMSDALEDGRKVRVLNIIDDYNRECLSITVGISMSSDRVIRILEQVIEMKGKPKEIRTDNGPEFTSINYTNWCETNDITTKHIQPGKPNQNGYIERFNKTFREDILNAYLFESINQLQLKAELWQQDYNSGHPHTALGGMSPESFKYSRSKIIDAYRSVKVKMNVSLTAANLDRSSTINRLDAKRLFKAII